MKSKQTGTVIDKNIPIPETRNSRHVLDQLNVGDSVHIKDVTPMGLSGALSWRKLRDGKLFTTRTVDGGVRVWRTK